MKFLSSIFLIVAIVAILFGIDKGFDWSDEGMYALLADPNQENFGGFFNYDLFFKLFYEWTGISFGLVGLRWIRLLSCFIAAFGLSHFWKNFNQESSLSIQVFVISMAGVLVSYGFLPPSFSYNSINLLISCLWLGLISKKSLSRENILLLGLLLSILFYAKITVCVLLFLFTLLRIAFTNSTKNRWLSIVGLVIPFLLIEIVFLVVLGQNGWLRVFDTMAILSSRPEYEGGLIVKYTLVGVFWTICLVIPFLTSGYLHTCQHRLFPLALAISILLFGIVGYTTMITSEWNHWIFLTPILGIAFFSSKVDWSSLSRDQVFLFALLLLLPFVLHFGSNVYFLRLGIHYWVFWVLAFLFIWKKTSKIPSWNITAIMTTFSLLLVVNGVLFNSFNSGNILHANKKWLYSPGKSILLTPADYAFYAELEKEIKDVPNLKVVSIYRNPGLLYMLGKNYPKTPGIWTPNQVGLLLDHQDTLDVILVNSFDNEEVPFPNFSYRKSIKLPSIGEVKIFWKATNK